MASPHSLSPVTKLATAPEILFCSKTFEMMFVTAMEQSGVVGEGFHTVALPAAMDNARFLVYLV